MIGLYQVSAGVATCFVSCSGCQCLFVITIIYVHARHDFLDKTGDIGAGSTGMTICVGL